MVPFHRLLILTAIVFCAGFAVWGWNDYRASHSAWSLASTIAFAVFAVGLGVYFALLRRWLDEP